MLLAGLAMARREEASAGEMFDSRAFGALAAEAGLDPAEIGEVGALIGSSENVVVVWGERVGHPLFDLGGVRYLEIPSTANGRGLREVGCVPNMGPGLAAVEAPGRSGAEIRDAACNGELGAIYLLHSDPVRERPGKAAWEEALAEDLRRRPQPVPE